jgi:hypothetical protein
VRAVKKTALLTMLSVLLMSAMFFPSMCKGLTVGVQVGDWFKYEGTLVSYEAGPDVPFPPSQYDQDVVTFNTTDWFKYTVTAIDGATITFEVVTHWSNGTETTETLVDDMENSFTMMCIGTNLGPGDQVRPEYDWTETLGFPWIWATRTLNATTEDPYAGGTRTANVLDWWMPPLFEGMEPTTRQVYHWDKATGIQTFYETQIINGYDFTSGEDYSYDIKRVIVDSSTEGLVIPEVFTTLVLLLTLSASTVSIVFYRRKKLYI